MYTARGVNKQTPRRDINERVYVTINRRELSPGRQGAEPEFQPFCQQTHSTYVYLQVKHAHTTSPAAVAT